MLGRSDSNQYVQQIQKPSKLVKDPVCGMDVDPSKAYHTELAGKTYYFCGARCKASFKKARIKMVSKPPAKEDKECCKSGVNLDYICQRTVNVNSTPAILTHLVMHFR